MSLTLRHDSQHQLLREFRQLADGWASLGLWCTMWSDRGKLLCPIPQDPVLWRTLWNRGQGLRNEIAHCVQGSTNGESTATLLGVDGIRLYCLPVTLDATQHGVVAICHIDDRSDWGEDLARLCSRCQLDEQLLRGWLDRHLCLSEEQAACARDLVQRALLSVGQLVVHQGEVDAMTTQLTDAYEELNLIYRIGATMRVTQQPRDHFTQLFEDLAMTTPFTTMAAVLDDDELLDADDRLIMGGEPVVDQPCVLRIADQLRATIAQTRKPQIINDLQDCPQLEWARGWLERLIAVPIICNQSLLGLVLVLNQSTNVNFDSTDVRLVHAVVDRSAIFLENARLYGDLNKLLMGLMHALVSSIDAKDPYTCGHSNRVALVSQRIAEKSGKTAAQAERVYLSGLLHDVGKIGISELILCKPGRLNDDEMREMRKHPEIGARILSGIRQIDDIIPGVLYHHEWISGRGYPTGRAGDQIPWIAKVVGLADAFDAMTSGRNYRSALPLSAAMAEIRRFAGTQFCPVLADAMIALVHEGLDTDLEGVKRTAAFDSVYTKWVRNEHLS